MRYPAAQEVKNTTILMPASNICLFFSDTGGGHRSAALAIAAGIRHVSEELWEQEGAKAQINVISDNIIEKSNFINRALVDFYNFLLRHDQSGMRYYYWLIQHLKPNESSICCGFIQSYLRKVLNDHAPSVIISVHPMINQSIIRSLQELGLRKKTKFMVVVTDPNDSLWRGWACAEADLIIVPNEAARGQLITWGVPQQKIQAIGMPVHPAFLKPPKSTRREFLSSLGLDPEVLTVCLNAGWAGGGNLTSIYQALHKTERKIQIIFLCGYHQRFYKKMHKWLPYGKIPTRVFPFHDNMPELMNAVDLMVTKAGGLTTFEALARRLPLAIDVITEPMPQEAGTISILLQADLARVVEKPDDIISIVESAHIREEGKVRDLPSFQNLNRVGAVYDIARIALSQLDPAIGSQIAETETAKKT
jgi:UDP-N-acetylglucosamine:LPS N-acetylglucosamine transferase